jgi:hypothetical protein
MGYAIVGGIGLAVGLGLMVWALLERKKRSQAELALKDERVKRIEAQRIADANRARVTELSENVAKLDAQLFVQRQRISECRERLAEGGTPAAIKRWLDSELGEDQL